MSVIPLFRRRERHGLHAADPLADAPTERLPAPALSRHRKSEPHGIATPETLAGLYARARDEASHWEGTSELGVMPVHPIAADYRALPVFQAVVRGACQAGLTGLGTRGVHPAPPLPDYGLDRFTADAGGDDFGPEFDEVAARAEAGFYEARRVFHSADTAGFPAVTA